MTMQLDVVIIGSGPGGEGAAMKAVKSGKSVAVVESRPQVGGNCAHLGTIPSKSLRHLVRQIIRYNSTGMYREIAEPKEFSFPKILARTHKIIEEQVRLRSGFYHKHGAKLFFGHGRIVDPHTVEVVTPEGLVETLSAEQIIVASGSSPYHPEDIDFDHPRVFDSDSILSMDFTPQKIIIYGAGVIGCEYASIFCGLGGKVDLINTRSRLLDFLDAEITDALSYHFRDQGVVIRHSEEYEKVETLDNGVILHLKSGKKIKADAMLWCNGRTGNTDGLNLEAVGIQPDSRGYLSVNEHYQTSCESIYAVGDVIGWPSLASAAYDQGRSVASFITDGANFYIKQVPTGIYTIPEISSVGQTEQELTEKKVPYEIGQAFFKTLARAQISGETVGMLKILFHRETLEILGIHCFGYQASEIVHIGQAIMAQEGKANTIEYFVNTTFNYPTMAEAYRVAALNGLHRIF